MLPLLLRHVITMKAYVVGAGVSYTAGYPLGGTLFDEIDQFALAMGLPKRGTELGPAELPRLSTTRCKLVPPRLVSFLTRFLKRGSYSGDTHRDDYAQEWRELRTWLSTNKNPLVAEAFRARKIEHLFTVLDMVSMLSQEKLLAVARSCGSPEGGAQAEAAYTDFEEVAHDYKRHRKLLLVALERYFNGLHESDHANSPLSRWSVLTKFASKLRPGDVVITFNYDATIERVLWQQQKWSPKDGYGFELVFQKSESEPTREELPMSAVKILKLHGSIGWYVKPVYAPGYYSPLQAPGDLPAGGAVPREEFGPTSLETTIALDPTFLRNLGITAVDAMLLQRPAESQVFLHPSFLKDFEQAGSNNDVFIRLWHSAAKALREANEVFVIGYSLPAADSAALTLLLTNTDRCKITVINSCGNDSHRLRNLLAKGLMSGIDPVSLEEWLDRTPDIPN